jgi:hypothetical protein
MTTTTKKIAAENVRLAMIDRLTEAFGRAKAAACNSHHGALIIERIMNDAGYRIAKPRTLKPRASASAGAPRDVVCSVDPSAGEGLR